MPKEDQSKSSAPYGAAQGQVPKQPIRHRSPSLAQRGDVIFVDEPIASLDIKHQLLSLQVLKDEARDRDGGAIVVELIAPSE